MRNKRAKKEKSISSRNCSVGCANGKPGQLRLTGSKIKQSDNSEQNRNNQCRVCFSKTFEQGYLFRCSNEECGAVHWHKGYIKKNRKNFEEQEFFESFLKRAGLSHFKKGENFVYVLRLRGGSKRSIRW